MAKSFQICAKESRDQSLALALFDDFDASSVCELINVLNESVKKFSKVAIDTDGLKTINVSGLDAFLPRLSRLNNIWADIEVTGRFRGVFREGAMERKIIERAVLRNLTEAAITCRPFAGSGTIRESDGVMRNFSSEGAYIETAHKYKSGTILIVRMVGYPFMPSPLADEVRPRSIFLAEVKWQRLFDKNSVRYGMGLKYLY